MKKILLVILLVSVSSYGQRINLADKFFNEYSYKKAADLYEQVYKKGDSSRFVLGRLGDSYYFNGDTEQSETWYGKLMKFTLANQDKNKDSVYAEHIFRYAQSLKSNGKYAESDKWLLKFRKLRPTDTRGASLESNPDYFLAYTKKTNSYINIYNVSANTKYSDFGTFISGKQVFFASSRPTKGRSRLYNRNEQPFLNLYTVKQKKRPLKGARNKINELDLSSISLLSGKVNTMYHEAMGAITKDGNTMYFTRDNYNGRRLRKDKAHTTYLKLYKAKLVSGKWSDIKELPFNSDNYSVGAPALSSDGKTLYFVSDMPGSYGATDIYKVAILGNNTYGNPENLGRTINTEGREMFPYIDSEGMLYFSSDGHIGLGGLDIFMSNLTKDGNYTKSYNLGSPFNSRWDDFAFVFDKLNVSGYFSSNRVGGKGDDDIYSFNIYTCKKSISGVVTDGNTELSLSGTMVRLIDSKGEVLQSKKTDSKGKYLFDKVACDKVYTVLGDKLDYKPDRERVSTVSFSGDVVKADLVLTPLILDNQIVINPIHFDFDKYNIRKDAQYELENIVTVMKNHPDMIIKIESHTDSRGSKSYNKRLSDKRAKSTRDYILSRGIATNRIVSAIGYGESRPLINCKKCTEEEHQINRRSYFYIVKGGNNVRSSKE